MTVLQVLERLDEMGVPYVVRGDRLLYKRDANLPGDLAEAIDAQRKELATLATAHYVELDIPVWHCHHCRGIVRPGCGRIVHPPDWRNRETAPVMHFQCHWLYPWSRMDLDEPGDFNILFADLILAAREGRLPSGRVTVNTHTIVPDPARTVLKEAAHVDQMDCWQRTSARGMGALETLEAIQSWWREQ